MYIFYDIKHIHVIKEEVSFSFNSKVLDLSSYSYLELLFGFLTIISNYIIG